MAFRFKGDQAAADADSNFPVAPDGTIAYLTVVEAKERKTKESGRDMLELEHLVAEGEYKERVRVWHFLTFIEPGAKGHGMTLHALHAYGFNPDGENDYGAEQFLQRTVKVELGVDTYQGKRKNVIKKFLIDEAAPEPAPATLADEEIGDASFNPEELEQRQQQRQAPPPAAAARPARRTAVAPPPARPAAPTPSRKLPWDKK